MAGPCHKATNCGTPGNPRANAGPLAGRAVSWGLAAGPEIPELVSNCWWVRLFPRLEQALWWEGLRPRGFWG